MGLAQTIPSSYRSRARGGVTVTTRPLEAPRSLDALRARLADRPGAAMLESLGAPGPWSRYSIYAANPLHLVKLTAETSGDPIEQLAEITRPTIPQGIVTSQPDLPFVGGWIGYLSYEAGSAIEPHGYPRGRRHALPTAWWAFYDSALIQDRLSDDWFAVAVELPSDGPIRSTRLTCERLDDWEQVVRDLPNDGVIHTDLQPCAGPTSTQPTATDGGQWSATRQTFLAHVTRALAYIRAGDVYQVNLSRRFALAYPGHPMEVYRRLCRFNPAPYASYIRLDNRFDDRFDHRMSRYSHDAVPDCRRAILSSSPELFLKVDERTVVTRPIKGTRPRGWNASTDAVARSALANSAKDRAELNMIIDLERNDLGRVCEYDSIRVVSEGEIEEHPTVYHRVATLTGRLREQADVFNLLRATFPGGSITGAPKVRAMQIISELETYARGPYCGAIGYVGLDGNAQFNLAIRTLAAVDGQMELTVGSGIVAESTPEDEYEELEAKAAGMLAALCGCDASAARQETPNESVTAVAN